MKTWSTMFCRMAEMEADMKSDVGLREGTERLIAENRGRRPESHGWYESHEETSSLDPMLCIIAAIALAALFFGVVYVAFYM